jgi:hypothetical protein
MRSGEGGGVMGGVGRGREGLAHSRKHAYTPKHKSNTHTHRDNTRNRTLVADRETDRQRHRQTERQRDRETDRKRERQTERQTSA